jgi:putative pyruvate formate lyase activating enzyme
MNQYTPLFNASSYPEIDKTLNSDHYDALIDYALSKGITNGFIQGSGTSSKEFIPDFDLRGI